MDSVTVKNGAMHLQVTTGGRGPLLLFVHGWPELSYSWRLQLEHFASRGYTVAAPDMRGYGRSSRPAAVEDYMLRELGSDLVAVIDQLGGGQAVLVGHDWGAPIAWTTAMLHPAKVRGLALLSVPFIPLGETSFIEMMRVMYADRFFYQLYFQREGVAEAELEADVRGSLRRIYFAFSGDAPRNVWLARKPRDAKLLDGLVDPEPFPDWLADEDLRVFADAFATSGFRGPLNRYRAQNLDFEDLDELRGEMLGHPTCFIGGERDMVRAMIPGMDLYENPGVGCTDFRGATIVPGEGHLVQQEAPMETNAALERFLAGL